MGCSLVVARPGPARVVGRPLGHDKGPAGAPESEKNANRDQNWAERVESGKNATLEIGMLTHPAAGAQMRKYHRVILSLYAGFYNKGRDH